MAKYQVNKDISIANTINSDFYTDPAIHELSKENIFSIGLHFAGDMDMLPDAGFTYPVDLLPDFLDEPLLMVRDKKDIIHCLSNVCTHRANLLVAEPCKTGLLRCKYHGRTFALDGKMTFMPEFSEVKNFPCDADHLISLPVFQWGKLLFVSINKHIQPLQYFKEMIERMAFFPMHTLIKRDDLSKDYYIDANWALYCENYLEGFHIPFVHQGLSEVLDFGDYETELYYPYANMQLGVAKRSDDTFVHAEDSPDFGKNIAAYYFWVFPNMMFNFYPWGLSLNIVQPIGVNRTKISFSLICLMNQNIIAAQVVTFIT